MSRHYQAAAQAVTQQKKASSFKAPAVKPPTLQKKSKAKPLPQWNPDGPAVDPLARLSATAPIQAKLTVGAANDKYEQEADRVAKNVVQRLYAPAQAAPESIQRDSLKEEEELQTKPLLQRQTAADGGAVSTELESTIKKAKGGGQSLDTSLQAKMGQAMGADFSSVKVHTDRTSDQLNKSIQARAFTTGSDVFFKKGEYNPGSKGGQELIAHELTHVVQQGSAARNAQESTAQRRLDNVIQPLRQHPDGNYYSAATPKPHDDYKADNKDDAFFTAVSSGGIGGGHTTIFIEYFKGGASVGDPVTEQVDLTVGGVQHSGSGSSGSDQGSDVSGQGTKGSSGSSGTSQTGSPKGKIKITQQELPQGTAIGKMASKGKGDKKTWKRTYKDVTAAKAKANEVSTACEKDEYKYYLFGQGPSKGVLNCARFGQWVLKAGGVPIHIGFWKLPSSITKASETDESIQTVVSLKDLEAHASKLPAACQSKSEFVAAMAVDNAVKGSTGYIEEIGKSLEKYHKFTDPSLQVYVLKQAVGFMNGYLELLQKSGGTVYPERKRVEYLKKDFSQGLQAEVRALNDEVLKSPDSLWAGLVGNLDLLQKEVDQQLKVADQLFQFKDFDSLKDVDAVPSEFPPECQTQADFMGAMKISKKSIKGFDKYVQSMGRNLEKYHKFTDPILQTLALNGFVSAMEQYLDELHHKISWTDGKSSEWYKNAYEKHERVLYLREDVLKGFEAEIKAIKDKVTKSPDSPWADLVGDAENCEKVAGQLLKPKMTW